MKTDKIKKLIALFYEGETSPTQEQEIYNYFSQSDIAEELIDEKNAFLNLYSLSKAPNINMSDDARIRLENMIDELEQKENKPNLGKTKLWRWAAGVAASVLLLLGIGFYAHTNTSRNDGMLVDTYSSPQKAYNETQQALLLVSAKLNKGIDQYEKAGLDLANVNDVINETFKKNEN